MSQSARKKNSMAIPSKKTSKTKRSPRAESGAETQRPSAVPEYSADEIRSILVSIVDGSDDAILSKSLEGKIISWNKGAERLYGYTADEIIGSHISILCPPEDKDAHDRIIERIKRGEKVEHFETERIRKGGGQDLDFTHCFSYQGFPGRN
jgi:PAS domain S-box-containing protein